MNRLFNFEQYRCEKTHPDGRVCCKLINHEGRCASIEGKWMVSWKKETAMSDATVPDILKLNADTGPVHNEFFAQLPPLSHKEAADALGVAQSLGLLAATMRDEFAAYICGWSNGAGIHVMRPEFTNHATLAAPYNEGYADGRKARNMAHVAASEKYGCKVSVVRVPKPVTKPAKRKCEHCKGTGDSLYEPNVYCGVCGGEGEVLCDQG